MGREQLGLELHVFPVHGAWLEAWVWTLHVSPEQGTGPGG